MKFRAFPKAPVFNLTHPNLSHLHLIRFTRNLQTTRASINGGGKSSQGSSFVIPGATAATILMLGVLHARRIYEDQKELVTEEFGSLGLRNFKKMKEAFWVEAARERGIELEFSPDAKASFMKLLPLRSISRIWGFLTSVEYPVWLRPYVYKAWARAFHSNLEEAALPLNQYASLREFFIRTLKEGSRPIDTNPCCLVSPVDGTVLRFGELKETGAMIEQIKGFSYSASSLLGGNSFLSVVQDNMHAENCEEKKNTANDTSKKSWWRISLASPKMRDPNPVRPMKGVFYCVIYLKPGDYHRVHSPVNWQVLVRRHFSGRLFPVNERARRTISGLYVENERVVLEGQWAEGFMALAAIGATNIGSIELFIEPELKTNRPKKLFSSEPPKERVYEPEGVGISVKKGEELAAFNMGSTVVLVFEAPASKSSKKDVTSSEFKFCVSRGDRIRMGEALGQLRET